MRMSGLPKAARLSDCFDQLVEWTRRVRDFTRTERAQVPQNPAYYERYLRQVPNDGDSNGNSPQPRQSAITCRPTPAITAAPIPATCSSTASSRSAVGRAANMPVLQIAIGRHWAIRSISARPTAITTRVGRASGESFNIESTVSICHAAQRVLSSGADRMCRRGGQEGCYLRNLTPREELAQFLLERHNCLKDKHWAKRTKPCTSPTSCSPTTGSLPIISESRHTSRMSSNVHR